MNAGAEQLPVQGLFRVQSKYLANPGALLLDLGHQDASVLYDCVAKSRKLLSASQQAKQAMQGWKALESKQVVEVAPSHGELGCAQEAFQWFAEAGKHLLGSIAVDQGLKPDALASLMDALPLGVDSAPIMHVSQYDAAGAVDGESCATHVDSSLVTLIYSEQAYGLQVQAPNGTWVHVPLGPSRLAVLAGFALEYATAGRIKATPHRVLPPPPGSPRTSLAFKLRPAFAALVNASLITSSPAPEQYQAQLTGRQLQHLFEELHPVSVNGARQGSKRAAAADAVAVGHAVRANREEGVAIKEEEEEEFIRLYVRAWTGKTLVLEGLTVGSTVQEAKEAVFRQEGIPVDRQRLIFAGRQLDDGRTLQEHNIGHESTVHLVLGLSGD